MSVSLNRFFFFDKNPIFFFKYVLEFFYECVMVLWICSNLLTLSMSKSNIVETMLGNFMVSQKV